MVGDVDRMKDKREKRGCEIQEAPRVEREKNRSRARGKNIPKISNPHFLR